MREVDSYEILLAAYRVRYLRPPLGHRRVLTVETVYHSVCDLTQIGGVGGQ